VSSRCPLDLKPFRELVDPGGLQAHGGVERLLSLLSQHDELRPPVMRVGLECDADWESTADFRAEFTNPKFRAKLSSYPSSAVASPHLFHKVAVAGICVA
jgi:hypothetical protein